MSEKSRTKRKPKLTIGETDYTRLSTLAAQSADRMPDIADELLAELDRAHVVPDGSVGDGVVQMGSTVTYKPDTGEARTVSLVYPGDADISEGKVSILTPIGTALLGLSIGQTMSWTARDGRRHDLSVLDVRQPEPSDAGVRRSDVGLHSASPAA